MSSYKVMLLGEIGVGKTSLVRRLIDDKFATDYGPTTGVDLYHYNCPANPPELPAQTSLIIWDTDGDFGENIFRHAYITGASAALIVGDASRPHTFETMLALAEGFDASLPGRPFSLVINKLDLIDDDNPLILPEALAKSDRLFRSSAKTGTNVKLAFDDTAATILRRGL